MRILIATFVFGLALFHFLERRLTPVIPETRTGPKRRGYAADLLHASVNGPGLGGLARLLAAGSLLWLPAIEPWFLRWSFAGQFAVYFLVNDFARYWLHRAYHASDLLWRVHRVHHATVEMDCLSLLRIHLLEAVVKNLVLALPFVLLGVEKAVVVTYGCVDLLKGFWHHANIRTSAGPLNFLLNTGELHWWHHSTERRGHRANYGSLLSVWDWLFGTAYWPRGEWPAEVGVRGMASFPDDYAAQLASILLSDAALRTAPDTTSALSVESPETRHEPAARAKAPRAA